LDLNVNKAVKLRGHELLSKKDWAYLPLKFKKLPERTEVHTEEHDKVFALHHTINKIIFYHVYQSLPFNKELPKTYSKNGNNLLIPIETFLRQAEDRSIDLSFHQCLHDLPPMPVVF
jgi:hypothetical protein